MESNHHDEEDSKTSSEEEDTDHHRSQQNEENHEHTTVSAGRSYECVFCKRGFSTAQALGGHMNIHRKDRAKTRPAADDHHHHHHHHHHNSRAIQGYPYPVPHDDYSSSSTGSHVNYQTYINPAASTWGLRPPVDVQSHDFCPPNSLLHPDLSRDQYYWRAGIGTSPEEDDHNNKDKINGGCSIDNMELDLELRLGHDPY